MVLPRLFNTASRTAFNAAKRNLMFSRGYAAAAPAHGKVRYVTDFIWIYQHTIKNYERIWVMKRMKRKGRRIYFQSIEQVISLLMRQAIMVDTMISQLCRYSGQFSWSQHFINTVDQSNISYQPDYWHLHILIRHSNFPYWNPKVITVVGIFPIQWNFSNFSRRLFFSQAPNAPTNEKWGPIKIYTPNLFHWPPSFQLICYEFYY